MKTAYREQDYPFGATMLTLRTRMGLTQVGLANRLGISRRAVGEWEAGSSYPKAEHLKEVIALGVKLQAFPKGYEAEEIRTLWKAASQKKLLDERWLSSLLDQPCSPHLHIVPEISEEIPSAETHRDVEAVPDVGAVPCASPLSLPTSANPLTEPLPTPGPKVDWGDALAVPTFYGREEEQSTLSQWVLQEHCRVVSILGMGGIGKSALTV